MDGAYVLHKRRYQETSLILQLLTRSRGRVSCIAKGVLRKRSKLSGVLEPLCLLHIETKGKSSLQTLINAEVSYRHPELIKDRLFAVFERWRSLAPSPAGSVSRNPAAHKDVNK